MSSTSNCSQSTPYFPISIAIAAFLLALLASTPGFSQTQEKIHFNVSVNESEVFYGESIRMEIQIHTAKAAPKPSLKALEKDFDIEFLTESPMQNSFTSIVNGRVTTSNYYQTILSYSLTPKRPGTLELPPLLLNYQGEEYRSRPLQLRVVEPEKQDIVIVEAHSSTPHVYPTQSFDVSVVILVKAVPELNGPSIRYIARTPPQIVLPWFDVPEGLNSQQVIKWLNPLVSDSGYGFSINNLAASSGFLFDSPRLALFDLYDGEEKRKDANGEEALYHRYVLRRSFHSDRPGKFSFGPVVVKGSFPIRQEEKRLIGKKILATSNAVEVIAKEVPTPRPETFIGGIGSYTINAQVSPTHCKVGDPITLTLELSTSDGNLELVSAPKLGSISEIDNGFELLDPNPVGIVDDTIKRYRYTMRPKSVDAKIPSLQFHVFDPSSETFRAIQTEPIPLQIDEAEFVSMAGNAKRGQAPIGANGEQSTFGASSDAAIRFFDLDAMSISPVAIKLPTAVATVGTLWGASLIYLGIVFVRRRCSDKLLSSRKRNWHRELQTTLDTARKHIEEGRGADAILEQRKLLAGLLESQSGDSLRLMTTDEILLVARNLGYSDIILTGLQSLLTETDAKLYSPHSNLDERELVNRYQTLFEQMLREKLQKPTSNSGRLTSWFLVGLLSLFAATDNCWGAISDGSAGPLNENTVVAPKQTGESNSGSTQSPLEKTSTRISSSDGGKLQPAEINALVQRLREASPMEARSIADQLADQVQDIVHRPGLVVHLGNAWFVAGEYAKAVYCYEIATRYWPGDDDVKHNLELSQQALRHEKVASTEASGVGAASTLAPDRRFGTESLGVLKRFLPSYQTQAILLILIGGAGAVLFAWATIKQSVRGWLASASAVSFASLLFWLSYNNSPERFYQRMGMVTNPSIVREGMSHKSTAAFSQTLVAGEQLEILRRTPNWTFVRHPDHGEGWVESSNLIYQFR